MLTCDRWIFCFVMSRYVAVVIYYAFLNWLRVRKEWCGEVSGEERADDVHNEVVKFILIWWLFSASMNNVTIQLMIITLNVIDAWSVDKRAAADRVAHARHASTSCVARLTHRNYHQFKHVPHTTRNHSYHRAVEVNATAQMTADSNHNYRQYWPQTLHTVFRHQV